MSYFNKIGIYGADSPSLDSFGRWRTSSPKTLFESKFIHTTASIFWSTKTGINATASYTQESASVFLNVSNQSGSYVIRQTRRRFNYQPGKSQLILNTANFGAGVSGVVKRVGYFDSENGTFFIQSGSLFGVGLRSTAFSGSTVNLFFSQSSWNLDKMNGTGPSGYTMDVSKSQIFVCDFEWLGVGRIRYGVYLDGVLYYVHEIANVNTLDSVYTSTPNLPVRCEITNYSNVGSARFVQICSAVISEGGADKTGIGASINNGITPLSVAVGAERVILALRKDPQYKGAYIIPLKLFIATGDANDGRFQVTVNPITSSNLSWQTIPGAHIQYATGSTETISGGFLVSSGYLIGGTTQTAGTTEGSAIDNFQGIGYDVDGNPDILVASVQSIGGTNAYLASWDFQIET